MESKKYFLGLDIGTDSVGYAVTDTDYRLKKSHGYPMWGSHIFDPAEQAQERRSYRSSRRRLDRRQQRVSLLAELFAPEIAKVDGLFFIRIKESALYREDTSGNDSYIFFNDPSYTDKDYHAKYPTIHHLICELMSDTSPHDVRLVYLACAWLVAHRGHFLNTVDIENIEELRNIDNVYNDFVEYCRETYGDSELNDTETDIPWECDVWDFAAVLKKQSGVTAKEKEFYNLLFGGKKPPKDNYPVDRGLVIKLLSGGKVKPSELFRKPEEYGDMDSFSIDMEDDKFDELLSSLGDDGELLVKLKNLYDWSILSRFLSGVSCISEYKVRVYEQHKADLKGLKLFARKYCPDKYQEIFNKVKDKDLNNYVAYSYHVKSVRKADASNIPGKKASKKDFSEYLKKILKDITPQSDDIDFYNDMMHRLERMEFLPKQVDGDNRVLPNQLYKYELKRILENAGNYLPFLFSKDSEGRTVSEKILSVFDFRVPYYVGPLYRDEKNPEVSPHSWIVRKKEGKIYPWNFDEIVDLDKSEQNFIGRMLNSCSYLDGESALPKNSLIYTSFETLNIINNICVDGKSISVDCKQHIYKDIFMKRGNVSVKMIAEYLIANNYMDKDSQISGMSESVSQSLKPWKLFGKYTEDGKLTRGQAEEIIERLAYTEDKTRIRGYLEKNFGKTLNELDIKKIANFNLKDFGRLSKKFLNGIRGADKETGETFTVIEAMWKTNNNLMQLLSDRFTFKDEVEKYRKEYYAEHPSDINQRMDDLYLSYAVKRSVIRTFDIIKEVRHCMGCDPARVFVEMTRKDDEDKKGKPTDSRRKRIEDLYKNLDDNEVKELSRQLGGFTDNELQKDKYYLYFIQLGKCMYSGESINIENLKTEGYDIDHIWPRSYVKDDSLENRVLVKKDYNGQKDDEYPIPEQWRKNMYSFWDMLHKKNLMGDKKFKRLTRGTPFTDDEKTGFINRQLVETGQSTSAVATLLKEELPNTEIVYVKAGNVSDFRKLIERQKSRSVNDYHHAKDAYLNIVVGNVYNGKFTKRWFYYRDKEHREEKYNIKPETIFKYPVSFGDEIFWKGESQIARIKKTVDMNTVHYTRYPFLKKGEFFDQLPLKAGANDALYPRKKGLDPQKYGGYNKLSAVGFSPVFAGTEKGREFLLIAVDLLFYEKFIQSDEFAMKYLKQKAEELLKKTVKEISFPIEGRKLLKVQTMFSFDGFRACIAGKSGGGKQMKFHPCMNLILPQKWETYIAKLDKFSEKRKDKPHYKIYPDYDKISADENLELFDLLVGKMLEKPYSIFFEEIGKKLSEKREFLGSMNIEDQALALLRVVEVLKSGRAGACDLSRFDGLKDTGLLLTSSNVKNWAKKFNEVYIIDSSASGIYESRSENLLRLL